MLILPIIACIFCVVCLGPYRSAVHLLLVLVVFLFGWPWPCDLVSYPPEAAGFFLLLLLFPGFGVVVASSLVCSGGLGACGVTCSFLSSPFPPPWLSSGAFWSSQSCWSLPPDIWLYLRRSGCHTFGTACRGYWLVSSLRFMATKASALCGALPSLPCCGCCSCALDAALRYLPRVIQNPL